jgi:hypothetical protein
MKKILSEQEKHLIRHMALHYVPQTDQEKRFLETLERIAENEEDILEGYFDARVNELVEEDVMNLFAPIFDDRKQDRGDRFVDNLRITCNMRGIEMSDDDWLDFMNEVGEHLDVYDNDVKEDFTSNLLEARK